MNFCDVWNKITISNQYRRWWNNDFVKWQSETMGTTMIIVWAILKKAVDDIYTILDLNDRLAQHIK